MWLAIQFKELHTMIQAYKQELGFVNIYLKSTQFEEMGTQQSKWWQRKEVEL